MDTLRDQSQYQRPAALDAILADSAAIGFTMASDPQTGALLKTLAASKPRGRLLELGTGTGISTAWLLFGMDRHAALVSIDNDARAQCIATQYLGDDPRLDIVCADGDEWLEANRESRFDLIFADAWPGKFSRLELALGLLETGGFYLIDDLLPQDSWPEEHAPRVPELVERIEDLPGYTSVRMAWASGLMLVARQAD